MTVAKVANFCIRALSTVNGTSLLSQPVSYAGSTLSSIHHSMSSLVVLSLYVLPKTNKSYSLF